MSVDVRIWVDERRAQIAKSAKRFGDAPPMREALKGLDPTALRTLLGAATNATCLEEVQILLRYQQGRDRVKWSDALVTGMEKELSAVFDTVKANRHATGEPEELDQAAALTATAWLGFLVQIHRYLYEAAREVARDTPRDGARGPRR